MSCVGQGDMFPLNKRYKGKNIVQKRVKKKRKKNLGFYYMLYGAHWECPA